MVHASRSSLVVTPATYPGRSILTGLALAAAVAVAAPSPASAAAHADDPGDFLGTYTGPHGGDVDVLSINPTQDGTNLTFSATFAADVGTTPGALYVLGVNRGAGTEGLFTGPTPVGQGVFFDAVVVLFPNLTGQVLDFNAMGPPTSHPLAAGAISVSGATISAVIPLAFLPTNGFDPAHYLYNLWPRVGLGSNAQISDFAPDASSVAASVPEPGVWSLMLAGFGLLGAALRRRRRGTAAA